MKKNILLLKIGLLVSLTFILFNSSCTKMDYYYKDYVVPRTYAGKVDSAWISPGDHRMKLLWLTPADPTVNALIVYWNDYMDSAMTTINHSEDTGSFIVEGLSEGDYTFYVYTLDSAGNRSVSTELSTAIYGKNYQTNTINRTIDHVVLLKDSAIILWEPVRREDMLGTEFQYVDLNGEKQVQIVPDLDSITIVHDIDPTKETLIKSFFLPDSMALDTFYSKPDTTSLPEQQLNTLHLTGVGASTVEFIDFFLVRVYHRYKIPDPSMVDIVHLRGSGSKQNLLSVTSTSFSAWSSSLEDAIENWDTRNDGRSVEMGNDSAAQMLYEQLDEDDREAMQSAYETALDEHGSTRRVRHIETGDIILFHSIDRDIYVAIKALNSEDDGDLTIEFKISRY